MRTEGEGVSRRALFGAGLGRLIDSRLAGLDEPARKDEPTRRDEPPPPAFSGWGEGDAAGLGARLQPVAHGLLDACGVGEGTKVLVAAAGDGVLARAAAGRGARVTAVDASADAVARGRVLCEREGLDVDWAEGPVSRMPVDECAFDSVVSLFGASHAADPVTAAAELVRVARPDAPIALTAWTGFMAELLRAVGKHATRSQRWARFETAYLHFFEFPDLDVRNAEVEWRFAGVSEAVEELVAPAAGLTAEGRLRDELPALLDRYGDPGADGLVVRVAYTTVFARRPSV